LPITAGSLQYSVAAQSLLVTQYPAYGSKTRQASLAHLCVFTSICSSARYKNSRDIFWNLEGPGVALFKK